MDLNNLFDLFMKRCKTVRGFIETKTGRKLFFVSLAVFVLLFFAPLFHGSVGAALISCVAAPYTVLVWRRYDYRHAVVPAVFFCIPMVLSMLIYHTLSTAACLLCAIVGVLAVAIYPAFSYICKIKDDMYAYLFAGAVCVGIVIIASLLILLVSIAWWIFCLFLFLAVIAMFFTVVLSSAAYTATDDKRQQRKKTVSKDESDDMKYDLNIFAKDIGLKNELDPQAQKKLEHIANHRRRPKNDRLFYDVDE
ncbi:MAG: UbiA prenyltransferase family protein [Ruminococcus sp.]|nr:UbiA prenyltransferase family protein [Ruminococcus sp.]